MTHPLEEMARRIFGAATVENRCGELLECLFEGGSATVDPAGRLCLASADVVAQFWDDVEAALPDTP